jgi:hypothetical protein
MLKSHSAYPEGPQAADKQLNKACESCRQHKIRCLPNETTPSGQCQHCAKTNRRCVYAAPRRRPPRKRADARIADLEKQLAAMHSSLREIRNQQKPAMENSFEFNASREEVQLPEKSTSPESNSHGTSIDVTSTASYSKPLPHIESSQTDLTSDIIDRGMLTMDTAAELVALYSRELVEYYPAVILPEDLTCTQLRDSKPVLFLAIIAAASQGFDPDLSRVMNDELLRVYADRIFIQGQKSLELVQSLLITVAYYDPPDSVARLQVYQFTHIAATMALDIGIGSKAVIGGCSILRQHKPSAGISWETCRTILSCYLLAAG